MGLLHLFAILVIVIVLFLFFVQMFYRQYVTYFCNCKKDLPEWADEPKVFQPDEDTESDISEYEEEVVNDV
eukprot:COSAG01_NODE_330_length_18723_cov_96.763155_14_plen_71_part_00